MIYLGAFQLNTFELVIDLLLLQITVELSLIASLRYLDSYNQFLRCLLLFDLSLFALEFHLAPPCLNFGLLLIRHPLRMLGDHEYLLVLLRLRLMLLNRDLLDLRMVLDGVPW